MSHIEVEVRMTAEHDGYITVTPLDDDEDAEIDVPHRKISHESEIDDISEPGDEGTLVVDADFAAEVGLT